MPKKSQIIEYSDTCIRGFLVRWLVMHLAYSEEFLSLWVVGFSSWDLCVSLNPWALVGWLIGPQTSVGYTQGKTKNPTYREVCSGQTGHVEAVQVEFNPAETSYKALLDVFWKKHDPTQKNRQALYSIPSSLFIPPISPS